MEANLDIVDRYGLPLVILSLIALAVWRAWRFVRPLVRETLEEHIQLIKGLREGMAANTASLRKQSQALSAHAEALTLNAAFLRKIYDGLFGKRDAAPKRGKPTLLVVEDSPTDFLLLQKRLAPVIEEMDIDVLHAESLAEAVRKIDAADAVILDLLLPDASDARTNHVFAELTRLPIIVHTASPGSQAEKLAERIGTQIVRKDQPAVRKVMGG